MGAQETKVGDGFHTFSIYKEGCMVLSVFPKIHDEFFGFMDIQDQVVY